MKRLFNIILVLALLVGGYYYFYNQDNSSDTNLEADIESVMKKFEESLITGIPEDSEKINLKDVVGGVSSGIATRLVVNGDFSHYVVADLPEPEGSTFYEGWLVRGELGDSNFKFISTGRMSSVKGGYVLNFESSIDYTDFDQAVITLETISDETPEKHILEGSF